MNIPYTIYIEPGDSDPFKTDTTVSTSVEVHKINESLELPEKLGDAIIKAVRAVTKDWYLKRSREEAAKLKLKNG